MKSPSELYKYCCPTCESEEDFERIDLIHLKCSSCDHVDDEEMFVDVCDEIPEHVLKRMRHKEMDMRSKLVRQIVAAIFVVALIYIGVDYFFL